LDGVRPPATWAKSGLSAELLGCTCPEILARHLSPQVNETAIDRLPFIGRRTAAKLVHTLTPQSAQTIHEREVLLGDGFTARAMIEVCSRYHPSNLQPTNAVVMTFFSSGRVHSAEREQRIPLRLRHAVQVGDLHALVASVGPH
jgi:hypothetical protein